MVHHGRALPEDQGELTEVDSDGVRALRDIWHRDDFGVHASTDAFHAQVFVHPPGAAAAWVVG